MALSPEDLGKLLDRTKCIAKDDDLLIRKNPNPIVQNLTDFLILIPVVGVALLNLPTFLLGCCIWGRPPICVRPSMLLFHMWSSVIGGVGNPAPAVLSTRVHCFLQCCYVACYAPNYGNAWFLDKVLFDKQLGLVEIVKPVFGLQAARSGSTTLSHKLEMDKDQFVAPNGVQGAFPFLWLWYVACTLSKMGLLPSPEWLNTKIKENMTEEFLNRHEADIFKPDTFEVPFFLFHLFKLSVSLGATSGMNIVSHSNKTLNPELWADFMVYLDEVSRKSLLFDKQMNKTTKTKQIMIKGHFMAVGEDLYRKYPDSRFISMARDPASRIQSCVNYVFAALMTLDSTAVIDRVNLINCAELILVSELTYSAFEIEFFTKKADSRKATVVFDDYVTDPAGALAMCYKTGCDLDEVPALHKAESEVSKHADRTKTKSKYKINFKLSELGVNTEVLDENPTVKQYRELMIEGNRKIPKKPKP